LILAQEAGHPGAVALALSSLSKVAFWDRQRKRAGELARRGYECCPANSTRVLLACQEADAADVPAAREAIRRAVEAYEDMMADDDLPGLFSCGRVRRACYTMTLHLRADEPSRVLDAAAEADAAYAEGEEVHYATWAQVQISAAIAYLRGGEVEGAAYRLAPVLALPPEMRLATFDGKLAYIAAALAALRYRGDGVAGGLTEQVRAYLRQRQMDTLPYPMALGAGIGAGR